MTAVIQNGKLDNESLPKHQRFIEHFAFFDNKGAYCQTPVMIDQVIIWAISRSEVFHLKNKPLLTTSGLIEL